ncbi:MAG: TIGR03960 family B12-binding radical SAM protein [Phycisphaerae bacterium]
MAQSLVQRVSREILPFVRKPAQYIGGEFNQLVRPGDWEQAEIRVVIGFPDAYAIGMSHLGCQILYWLCNHTPGVCAERAYCPWIDAEAIMRREGIPLFTWDTRQPAREADLFCISLQYELCFTSVLNMLDLAGIPLRAAERTDADPLVIAGGPQSDNCEPMAEFLDLVVIGDGEHAMAAILEAVREYKRAGVRRRDMILLLARRFPWIYAPNLYEASYHADGTLAGLLPLAEGIPSRIQRCATPDFETCPFPTRPLLPWIEVVHDRIGIEIMRGCPQVCRFCHAGYTKRPLKLRSVDRVLELAEEAYWATGHREIGLLSLSTADYPYLSELSERMNERFNPRMVNLSLPSLRVDKMLRDIPWMVNSIRKSSITMAVEAASDDLRGAIRKKVTDGNLLDGVRQVYKAGWRRLKLYFMAGFPAERPVDIDNIYRLCDQISRERQRIGRGPGEVVGSVGWLVPKPFTPLQWMAQPRVEYFREVRERLRRMGGGGVRSVGGNYSSIELEKQRAAKLGSGDATLMRPPRGGSTDGPTALRRNKHVKITMPDPEAAILEGVFARGDRRLSRVIHEAWKRGARFDGWTECFDNRIWMQAFDAAGIDPDWYAHRERAIDELLPWDHIGLHMRRGYLEESYADVFERLKHERPAPGVTRALPIIGEPG